jgi:AraC-like DNA-binding protein
MTEQMDQESIVGGYVIERTIEILCAEAIRAHVESTLQGKVRWLDGIRDPVIGRAIAAIHTYPNKHWSVQLMANNVAMSPSRFAARFAKSVGDSPMAYLTKWRMNLACRALLDSKLNIDQIGVNVGYDSAAAFSRTFKKHLSLPPAQWRSQQTAIL